MVADDQQKTLDASSETYFAEDPAKTSSQAYDNEALHPIETQEGEISPLKRRLKSRHLQMIGMLRRERRRRELL